MSAELANEKKLVQIKRQELKEKEAEINLLKTQQEQKLDELNEEFNKIKSKAKDAFDG